jgi:hypothetical protein
VDGVDRMQALVRDLLAWARVETRGASLLEVAMDDALDAAVAGLTTAREETGAVVTRDALPRVRGDQTQLTALFQNLLGNSIKFRSAAPPRIHVGAVRAGEHWRFTVTDNGIGIPVGQETRVFVIFQRLHTREEYPGTGIGLALCKRIVERHGGAIGVAPAEPAGTTVWFTLPAASPACAP